MVDSHVHLHLFNLLVSDFLLRLHSPQLTIETAPFPLFSCVFNGLLIFAVIIRAANRPLQRWYGCNKTRSVPRSVCSEGLKWVQACYHQNCCKVFLLTLLLTSFVSGYLTLDLSVPDPRSHYPPENRDEHVIWFLFSVVCIPAFWSDLPLRLTGALLCETHLYLGHLWSGHRTILPHAPFIPHLVF